MPGLAGAHQSGETMAALRTRLDADARCDLKRRHGVQRHLGRHHASPASPRAPPIVVRYTGNANPADDLATPAPVNGLINYPQHIQPIWSRDRGANTCTDCHADTRQARPARHHRRHRPR